MNISIFGLGYVGCVSLGCLAKNGNFVFGVDVDPDKVSLINSGKPTIIEKQIDEIIDEQFKLKRIKATIDYTEAILSTDISFISVGTPSTSNGHLDLKYVFKVAEEIGQALTKKNSFHTIVIRSTVLPGTNDKVSSIIEDNSGKKRNIDFGVVSNPEFLREGSAVKDYYNPAITVIGSDCSRSLGIVSKLYENINAPIVKVRTKEAELIKYVNNSFHALKITFANEIGNISKSLGIDGRRIMDLFAMDDKLNISKTYFKPGFAYGGSCLPKDLKGLSTLAHDNYLESPVLESIEKSNSHQKKLTIKTIERENYKKIGVLGLSFKSGTDDLRYSPIVEVAEYFLGKGYELKIYDHNVSLSKLSGTNKTYIDNHIPHLSKLLVQDIGKVISDSELIVITHNISGIEKFIKDNPKKLFLDLISVIDYYPNNYIGLTW